MQLTPVSTKHFHLHPEAPWLKPMQMTSVVITESPIALAITAILIICMISAIPESAFFFLGILLLGALTGLVLWKRHSSGF
jgi:hypothetical protein